MITGFTRASGAEARLVCFPCSGTAGEFYRPAARMLAPEIEVLAVRYPGEVWAGGDVRELASRALPSVRALTGPPMCLFGHGRGALVAFEVARFLEAAGAAPDRLIVAAAAAPARLRGREPLGCPIFALAGEGDPGLPIERVGAWRKHTSEAFELEVFDGGPDFLETCSSTTVTAVRDRILPPPTWELPRK